MAIGYGGHRKIPLFFWECLYKAGLMEWNVLCVLTDEALMIVPTNPYFGTFSGQGFLIPHNGVPNRLNSKAAARFNGDEFPSSRAAPIASKMAGPLSMAKPKPTNRLFSVAQSQAPIP